MISEQIILGAIAAILGADAVFLVSFLAYLTPKYQDYVVDRRKSLDEKLMSEINNHKTNSITIESFMPLFEEHEVIENWRSTLKQIPSQLGYSIFLVTVGLVISLLGVKTTVNEIPIEAIFIVGGALFLVQGVYTIVRHSREVSEWRVSR